MESCVGDGDGKFPENRPNDEIDPWMIDYRENSPVGHRYQPLVSADLCLQFETNL